MNRPQKANSNRTVGVIVCTNRESNHIPPFAESSFFRQLSEEATSLNLDLIIFNPKEVDWEKRTVKAWLTHSNRRWISKIRPLPNLIYDRCYYFDLAHYKSYQPYISKLKSDPLIRLLGRPLGGKIQTHEMLLKNEEISPYLPETKFYRSPQDVLEMIHKHKKALVKPNGGSHGIGVAGIIPKGTGFMIRGRSATNQAFQQELPGIVPLINWIKKFIGNTRYIVQPFLLLSTVDGNPFDLRILLQKNEKREWERTGLAIRVGKASSITSNLHGGGDAEKVNPFLAKNFEKSQIAKIWSQIDFLSLNVPQHIEGNHGSLVELGLDLGIDRNGKVWILELNSKPGRSVFLRTGELETRKRAIQLPILYAKSLLSGQLGGKL